MSYLFDNAQGKWRLSNQVYTDGSGNGYTLTFAGTPAAATGHAGDANGAANLNGSSKYLYIADASAANLDITGNLSISAWIYLNAVGGGLYHMIAAKLSTSGNYSYDFHVDPNGNLKARLSSNGTALTSVIATTVLTTGTWYHVAVVYDGTDIRLYLNGSLDCTPVSYSSGIYNSTADFCIGIASDKTSHTINGVVDDVAVWNRALTTSEITALYNLREDFAIAGSLTGTIKDKNGTAVNCSTYNVRVNVYQKGNSTAAPLKTALITSSDGTWSISGLTAGIKYCMTFEYEGSYTPTSETDIAGQEFLTAA